MSRVNEKPQQSRPKKKYQRSQSPAAKEKRKIQNRIAQQNHRRRMKEQSSNLQQERTVSPSSASEQSVPPAEPMNPMSASMDALPTVVPSDPYPVPSISNLSESIPLQSEPNPYIFPFLDGCTCGPMTGPCPIHLDQIKFNMSMESMMNPPTDMFSMHEPSMVDPALTSAPIERNSVSPFILDTPSLPPPPPLQQRGSESSSSSSMLSPRSYRIEKPGSFRSRRSTSSSKTSKQSSLSLDSPRSPSLGFNRASTQSPPLVPKEHTGDSISHNTARFTKILAACREADFADFDSMVSTYYTCTMEKSSVPEMAQRASRTRRLPRVMRSLHTSSMSWPRYESRGIHEATTEHAKTVYEEELQEVAQNLDQSMEEQNLLALDELRRNGGALDKDRAMAQLTSLPEELEVVVQDKAPKLWSLLTELAGPESLYCDKVSHAVVALLINGRKSQGKR